MKALHLLILLPLSILCLKSTAQVDDLMRDKNITWIAESYNDFMTDSTVENVIGKPSNDVTTLKFTQNTEGVFSEKFALQQFILKAIKDNKLAIFKDADCKEPMTYDDICRFDTLQNGNFENVVVRNEIPLENLPVFRARQIIFYSSQKVQFGLRTLAVALMYKQFNEDNQHIGWLPAFWIKAQDFNKKRRLNDASIVWSKALSHQISLKFDSLKSYKMDYWQMMDTLVHALTNKPNVTFSDALGKKINMKERIAIISKTDTLLEINSSTNKIENIIVVNTLNPKYFINLRIVQNWYWNDKKKQLEIWLWGIGPLKDVKNDAGDLLYRIPLFYRRTDD